jgi:hypothetical protein
MTPPAERCKLIRMRSASLQLAFLLGFPALAAAQQFGVPLSSLPGVEVGVPAVAGGSSGGVQGVAVPGGTLERLLMTPTGTSQSAGSVGQQIERSFFGDRNAPPAASPYGMSGGPAGVLTGEGVGTRGGRSGSVTSQGTGVQLPTAQQLMPQHLIPGYQTTRGNGQRSPTGVGNVFTGTGQPRSGDNP